MEHKEIPLFKKGQGMDVQWMRKVETSKFDLDFELWILTVNLWSGHWHRGRHVAACLQQAECCKGIEWLSVIEEDHVKEQME